jgi:hypothetical protein
MKVPVSFIHLKFESRFSIPKRPVATDFPNLRKLNGDSCKTSSTTQFYIKNSYFNTTCFNHTKINQIHNIIDLVNQPEVNSTLETRRMTSPGTFEIPYLYTGISPVVEEWLRLAGLPLVPFRMATIHPEQGKKDNQRIVLYDSRNHLSRADAHLAEQIGYIPLNLATLLYDKEEISDSMDLQTISDASEDRQKRETVRFLLRLKIKIENMGGHWVRLSDFPYPYQSVIVVESSDNLLNQNLPVIFENFDTVPANIANQEILDWYPQQYTNKTPVLMTQREAGEWMKTITDQFPLTWNTSVESFIKWWEFRSQIQLRIETGNRQYQLLSESNQVLYDAFRPSVEIWKEEHVANFELKIGGMSVREDQLVFVNCGQSRTPIGFAPIIMTRPSQWKKIETYSAQTA